VRGKHLDGIDIEISKAVVAEKEKIRYEKKGE
jgi:hypothetical protein